MISMIELISNELIIHIGSYCSINDIYNLSQTCKAVTTIKLYKLYMSPLICHRLIGEYCYKSLKNQMNDFEPYNSLKYQYTYRDYIEDIINAIFNQKFISTNLFYYRRYKFNLPYKHSRKLLQILKNTYKLTKNNKDDKNELRYYPRCHHIYRICPTVYSKLSYNVLALIY